MKKILLLLLTLSYLQSQAADPLMQTLTGETTLSCPSDATLTLQGSEVGFNYFLRNEADDSIVDGPIAGTGNALDFQTGVVSETSSYHVAAAAQNTALNFDGTNDYVEINHHADLQPTTQISIDAWVYPTDLDANTGHQEIYRKDNNAVGRILFSFQKNGAQHILSLGIDTSNGGYVEFDANINKADYENQWVHVLATYDGANMRIYRNGQEVTGSPLAKAGTFTNPITPSSAYIGSWAGITEYFKGKIASLRIWDKALTTQQEIDQAMANVFVGNEDGLVAYYNFDGGDGTTTTLDDQTANINHGDIIGATWDSGIEELISNTQTVTINPDNIIYVDKNATGNNDGTCWANAFNSIQLSVTSAATDQEIHIAQGTYKEGNEILITNPLTIKGGYPTGGGVQDVESNPTFIDGNNMHRVLKTTHTSGTLFLDGLTIQNGDINVVNNESGAGIGVFTLGNLSLINVIVRNNDAFLFDEAFGCGIYSEGDSITIINSKINNNQCKSDSEFRSDSNGGGIFIVNGTILLINSVVSNNIASSTSSGQGGVNSNSRGGGVYIQDGSVTLKNSLILNNKSESNSSSDGSADAASYGGGIYGTTIIQNSILWGNKELEVEFGVTQANGFNEHEGGTLTTSNSLVKGRDLSAENGIDDGDGLSDPMYVNEANGDYRLQSGSLLINAGLDSSNSTTQDLDGNLRKFGTIDIGPYEFQQASMGVALDVSVSMFQVTLDYYLENLSSLDLQNITLPHDLETLFGAGNYSIQSALSFVDDPNTLTLNASFDGSGDTAILDAGSTLAGLDTAQVRLVVVFNTLINSGDYSTQVTVNAQDASMNMASDLSDFASTIDDNNNQNANETGENDATTFSLMTTPATFAMNYTPDSIVVNNSSTLQYTIDNSAGTTASNLAFSQTLPTGLVVADTANAINNCGGTFTANGTNISLTSGTVNAASTCTISVDITATQGGTFNTTTGDFTSSAGNSGAANDTLTVDGAPIVTAPAKINTEATANLTAVDIGTATATDLVDGSLTPIADNLGPYPVGETQVIWSAADSSGTVGSAIQTIIITDTIAPLITLIGEATIDLIIGDIYSEQGASAQDLVDGDISSNIITTGTVDTQTVGTYTINYNVNDTANNAAQQVTRTVNVAGTYFVGGEVIGLLKDNYFVLKINGTEEKLITEDGVYIFPTPLNDGEKYSVIIDFEPINPIQPCEVSNSMGMVSTENVTDVNVTCEMGMDLIFRGSFD